MDRAREFRWAVNSSWVVPLLCLAGGGLVAVVSLSVDAAAGRDLLPASVLGTPTAVRTILSTAASAMLTLTTIVLTVLTLGVQLAMQQFSPRIVRALLANRRSQLAHGLFVATFAYCMVAVAQVDDQAPRGQQVPSVTVVVAYTLLAASLVVLVLYVHHAGQSLRVAGLIDLVSDNLTAEIDRFPPGRPAAAPDPGAATQAGVVVLVDVDALVELGRRADTCIELLVNVGDFVPSGAPLLRSRDADTGGGGFDARAARAAVLLDNERSHVGDAAYGFRKLVDIAERSISSSPFDDPVTALQAVDRIHEGLRRLGAHALPDGRHRDAGGVLRVVTRELTWEGYVVLALHELVSLGAQSPVVARRLLAALDDLVAVTPPEKRPPLQRQRDRLLAAASSADIPLLPDIQGFGAGRDLAVMG